MIRAFLALVMLLLPVTAAPALAAAPRHVADRAADWSHAFAETPDGGLRIGNPQAKVKVIEYFSYTCPHCAEFAGEAFGPLGQNYVRGGQVSLELRPALRDAVDLSVALAVRCVAAPRRFSATEAVMAAQRDWFPKAVDWVGQHRAELNSEKRTPAIHAMLSGIGVEAILARQGVTPAALDACLVSESAEASLQKSTEDAWNGRHIGGTPAFLINDVLKDDIHGWAALESAIQVAIKG